MRITALFTLVFTIIFLSTCGKFNNCKKDYKFEFSTTIKPDNKEINLGDTLWIELSYDPSSLIDLNANETIDATDFDFSLKLLISEFDSSFVTSALINMDFGAIEGQIEAQELVTSSRLLLTPKQENNLLVNHFFIKPKVLGNYIFTFGTDHNSNREIEFIDNNCKEFLALSFKTNGGDDNNFDFYFNNSSDTGVTLEGFNRSGAYAFTVVE